MAYSGAVELTVQEISRVGKAVIKPLTAATATHGNKFRNNGRTFLRVKNGSGGDITATFNTPGKIDGQDIDELEVLVKANGDNNGLDFIDIGPFTAIFNQADGYVWVTFSSVSNVTVGAFRFANP